MHDVFISYKSEDSAVAIRVRDELENNGIRCWIAERDISAGSNYATDIPNAIARCKVLVLIFTKSAQESPWIMKELDSAIAARKLILPLKIGHFEVSETMSFLLTGVQYFDATNNPDEVMARAINRIRRAIDNGEVAQHRKTEKINTRSSSGCLPALLILSAIFALLHYSGVLADMPHYQEITQFLTELFTFLKDTFLDLFEQLKAKIQ